MNDGGRHPHVTDENQDALTVVVAVVEDVVTGDSERASRCRSIIAANIQTSTKSLDRLNGPREGNGKHHTTENDDCVIIEYLVAGSECQLDAPGISVMYDAESY